MKASLILSSALCIPAALAMGQLETDMKSGAGAKDIMKMCPDLPKQCLSALEGLIMGVMSGKQDEMDVKGSFTSFADTLKKNPECADPVNACLAAVQGSTMGSGMGSAPDSASAAAMK